MISVVGISGVATVGKDTFFRAMLKENPNTKMARVAFADELKAECNEFLTKNVGISAFTQDPNEKALIRPFLVTYGSQLRRKKDPSCWIKRAAESIKRIPFNPKYNQSGTTVVITDVRYPNELEWIHDEMKGTSIHLSREGVLPINEEEAENDPILKSMCHLKLTLPNFSEESCELDYTEYVSELYANKTLSHE